MIHHAIQVGDDGRVTAVYSDDLRELFELLGGGKIRRASHVEPDEDGRWVADLSPVGGPRLPATDRRSDALGAEREYLQSRLLEGSDL